MDTSQTTYGLPNKKEEVIEALKEAYANQNLEEDEYEKRLHEATNAKSIEALELVLFDFPNAIRQKIFPSKIRETFLVQPPAEQTSMVKAQVIMSEDERQIAQLGNHLPRFSAILSSQKIDFRLSKILDEHTVLRVESILSSTLLDLRNENLDGKIIDIYVSGILGDIKILLPKGGIIEREIDVIGGNYKVQNKGKSWIQRLRGKSTQEEAPSIQFKVRIRGKFWLGNVMVSY